jgi:glycerol-3-phosphate acyltransferase PlsY
MSNSFIVPTVVVISYLFGSIPFGKIVGNVYGVDIQQHGSGNIGFANVRRVLGWPPAFVVLIGDVSKGFAAPFAAQAYGLSAHEVMTVGAAAMAGSVFPVWLRFKGGKGIATGLGITLATSLALGCLAAAMYVLAVGLFRSSGRASLISAWGVPLLALAFAPGYALFFATMAALATWTHRDKLKPLSRSRRFRGSAPRGLARAAPRGAPRR